MSGQANPHVLYCSMCADHGFELGPVGPGPALRNYKYYHCLKQSCSNQSWIVCCSEGSSKCKSRWQCNAQGELDSSDMKRLKRHMSGHNQDAAEANTIVAAPEVTFHLIDKTGLHAGEDQGFKRPRTETHVAGDWHTGHATKCVGGSPTLVSTDDTDDDVEALVEENDVLERAVRAIESRSRADNEELRHAMATLFPSIPSRNEQTPLQQVEGRITNSQSREFMAVLQSGGCPITMMAMKCLHKDSWERAPQLSALEAGNFVKFASFVWGLETKSRKQIAGIIKMFQDNVSGRFSFLPVDIERVADLRRLIWDGKCSFQSLIPRPEPIILMPDDIVYISITESLSHMFAMDSSPDFDKINSGLSPLSVSLLTESVFATEKHDSEADYHLLLSPWSDGFNANYSTKVNRLKPWIMTGTLAMNENRARVTGQGLTWKATFPIAFGTEGCNKKGAEARFYAEMKELDRPGGHQFYFGRFKCFKNVRVTLALIRGDQPERRKFCGLVGVNGNHGPAFGTMCNFKEIAAVVPSCDVCLEHLMEFRVRTNCDNCLNWDYHRVGTHLNRYTPPPNFPREECGEDGKIQARELTFDLLLKCVEKAHNKLVSGSWSPGQAQAYLVAHALNEQVVQGAIGNALKFKLRDDLSSKQSRDVVAEGWLKHLESTDSPLYTLPPIWTSGVLLEQVPCLPMHLLFLGLAKQMLETGTKWLAAFNKTPAFVASMRGVLESVQRLGVPWCKALPYARGTGGAWVSENYVAFAKLIPWMYSILPLLDTGLSPKQVEAAWPPYNLSDPKCWTGAQCEQWLRHRNLDSSGKATEKKQRVREHMIQNTAPGLLDREPTVEQLLAVLQNSHGVISRLMTKSTTAQKTHNADCFVRVFLSHFARLDVLMSAGNKEGAVPEWVSHANFLSLRRVVEGMKRFGPPRLGWEGGVMGGGEACLKDIKPILKSSASSRWHYNCMVQLLCSVSIQLLHTFPEVQEKKVPKQEHPARVYGSPEDVGRDYRKGNPISALWTGGRFFLALARNRNEVIAYQLSAEETSCVERCGVEYAKILLEREGVALSASEIEVPVLLLPLLCSGGLPESGSESLGWYSVTSHDWQWYCFGTSMFAPIKMATWCAANPASVAI